MNFPPALYISFSSRESFLLIFDTLIILALYISFLCFNLYHTCRGREEEESTRNLEDKDVRTGIYGKKRIMSKNPTTTLEQQTTKFIYVNNPHQHNMESLE